MSQFGHVQREFSAIDAIRTLFCRLHFNHFSSKYSENLFSTFRNSSPDINNNFAFIFLSRKSKSIPEAQGNGEVEGI